MSRILRLTIIYVSLICEPSLSGENDETPWSYATDSPEADASEILLPVASLILPGFGQWWRGQYVSGSIYSGVAIGGIKYAKNAESDFGATKIKSGDLATKNVAIRKYLLANQTYQVSGGLSLYHTFRSSVWQRQKFGAYGFLGKGDSPTDILIAPFQFKYLARSSTFIPLGVVAAFAWYSALHPQQGFYNSGFSKEDPWFAAGFSYNAGTHEEAIFRGWGMPLFHEAGLSNTWSNLAQASLFAAAHLGSNRFPLPQFLLGIHLGNVTQNNSWTLSESIFIHVWWDVVVFLSSYHVERNAAKNTMETGASGDFHKPPSLSLPPISLHF